MKSTPEINARRTASNRRFSRRKYAALLAEALPRIVESPEELERLARQIEPLLNKGQERTAEEVALCRLVLRLIDHYQRTHRHIPKMGRTSY